MNIKKIKNMIEVSNGNIYMLVPANANGYNIFIKNGGSKEYKYLFDKQKKKVKIKTSHKK